MEDRQIKFTINSDLAQVALLGMSVNKVSAFCFLSEVECSRLELAVVEAVNNVIIHGYKRNPENIVEVICHIIPQQSITFEVYDKGKPMPKDLLSGIVQNADDIGQLSESGRGLFLINEVMDHLEYKKEKGRNIFILTKYLNR